MSLTDREQRCIDFERAWWLEQGGESKSVAIRRCLEISPATYRATIERLVDSPEALAYDPLLVRRLRRERAERRRARFAGEPPRKRHPH